MVNLMFWPIFKTSTQFRILREKRKHFKIEKKSKLSYTQFLITTDDAGKK